MQAPHEILNAEHVATLLSEAACNDDAELGEFTRRLESFACGGILTHDAGFTIKMQDGSEFQVTVVQSRETHADYLPDDGTLDDDDDSDDDRLRFDVS